VKANRPFAPENQSQEQVVLEPLLTPAMEKTVLACALGDPVTFGPWIEELQHLIPSGEAHGVAFAAAELFKSRDTVTVAAAFQRAWENTHEKKFRDRLTALQDEVYKVNSAKEQNFVLENIQTWLADQLHTLAMAAYTSALERFEQEPSKRNRDELELTKELVRDSLTGTPGSQAYKVEDACSLLEDDIAAPESIVDDLLEAEDVALLGSSSKAYKSWMMLTLAVCIVCGVPWYGMKTRRVKVCIVNFELKRRTLQERISKLCEKMGLKLEPGWLHVISLRGPNCAATLT